MTVKGTTLIAGKYRSVRLEDRFFESESNIGHPFDSDAKIRVLFAFACMVETFVQFDCVVLCPCIKKIPFFPH